MGNTHYSGPVVTGQDTGVPAENTQGTLIAEQRATVAAGTSGASSIVVPDCTIADIVIDVLVGENASAATTTVRIGTTADETKFAAIVTSAAGRYRLGVAPNVATGSAAAMETVTGPQRIYVDVTAAGSGADVFAGILSVIYVQR